MDLEDGRHLTPYACVPFHNSVFKYNIPLILKWFGVEIMPILESGKHSELEWFAYDSAVCGDTAGLKYKSSNLAYVSTLYGEY